MNRESKSDADAQPSLWAIVLAAGEGTRLATVTRKLYGHDVPKQFAALDGDETLLQRTMDRVGRLVPPRRTVVVVAKHQQALAEEQLARYPGVQIVCQPRNVGTGPGLLLPLSVVAAQDPEGQVLVTPSDHHVSRPEALVAAIEQALVASARTPSGIALVGAVAEGPASDLGWIVPGRAGEDPRPSGVAQVESFVEKPAPAIAEELFRRGALWNTLILVGAIPTLWSRLAQHLPRQTALFDGYLEALRRQRGQRDAPAPSAAGDPAPEHLLEQLEQVYSAMPSADLSRHVLQLAEGLGVVRLEGSGWCDCGTPERLLACLNRITGRRPRFLRTIVRALQAGSDLDPSDRTPLPAGAGTPPRLRG
jgi:mannose-1-phosphate guanylyltransferase